MYALRRLTTAAFGTLMCLEPALALLAGLVLLGQVPRPWSLAGAGFVVAAGIGAERTGARNADGAAGLDLVRAGAAGGPRPGGPAAARSARAVPGRSRPGTGTGRPSPRCHYPGRTWSAGPRS